MFFGLFRNDGNMIFDRIRVVNVFDKDTGELDMVVLTIFTGFQFQLLV
jgi:hypothetical protein